MQVTTIRGEIMAKKKAAAVKADVAARARAAGLAKALARFPRDVEIAAAGAAQTRTALGHPAQVSAEPWPPMRVRSTS